MSHRPEYLAALALLFIPAAANADSNNPAFLLVVFVLLPAFVISLVIGFAIWLLVPYKHRPWVLALCAIPWAPIHNGYAPWPLFVYVMDSDGISIVHAVISVLITAAIVATLSYSVAGKPR